MPRYFAIDKSGNIRQSDTPPPVITNEVIGAANGVDLTIRGYVGQQGSYTSAGRVNIIGGTAGPGYANYAGDISVTAGANASTYGQGGLVLVTAGTATAGGNNGGTYLKGNNRLSMYGDRVAVYSPLVLTPVLSGTPGATGSLYNNSGTVGQPGTIQIA